LTKLDDGPQLQRLVDRLSLFPSRKEVERGIGLALPTGLRVFNPVPTV
jgi:hypothetical protein